MLSNFLTVFNQILILFAMIAIGYILSRMGKLTHAGTPELSFLLVNIACPMSILNSLQTDWDPALLRMLLIGFVSLVGCSLLYIIISIPLFRRLPTDTRHVLQYGTAYGNLGFMGLPLIQAVLGDRALIFVALFMAAQNLFIFSHGVALVGGRQEVSFKKVFLNPGLIAAVVGISLFLLRIRLGGAASTVVKSLSNLTTPLAMLITGAQVARTDLRQVFRQPPLYFSCAVRFFIMPSVTAAVLYPLRSEYLFYVTAVTLSAAPSATLTAVFAERYIGKDCVIGAQLVSLSTLLSGLSLPIVAAIAQTIAS